MEFIDNIVFESYVLDQHQNMEECYYGIYYMIFCVRTKGDRVYCLYNLTKEDFEEARIKEKYTDFLVFIRNRIIILSLIMAVQSKELCRFMTTVEELYLN